ncbi:MAG: UDP-N-acetylmuramoyl-tripeptide--D-alanyl-D-alanine ligase [Desulfonatronovibrionaceae bacterium]
MKMTLSQASLALKSVGDLQGLEDLQLTGVQTDSRLVKPGQLFFCISGEKFDGHSFARQAVENKAAAVVVHRPMQELQVPVLLVEDTVKALGRLACFWRKQMAGTVICITGSAGKTTTKEMLAQVLGMKFKTGKNFKNWNNQVGLPLSMLLLDGDEDFWVLELGINNPWDMQELAETALPDWAVLLNVGASHLQGLGSVQGVARAKAELLDHSAGVKQAFVNQDYVLLRQEVEKRDIEPVWFSCIEDDSDCRVQFMGRDVFLVTEKDSTLQLNLEPGWFQYCENIAAVWCLARKAGMEASEIASALKQVSLPEQRFAIYRAGNWTIIDDTYNANPISMHKAIDSAKNMAQDGPLYLVLGDMAELGPEEAEAHAGLGRKISRTKCRAVFFRGKNADLIKQKVQNSTDFYPVSGTKDFKYTLAGLESARGTVLFKGSRSSKMEELIPVFRDWALKKEGQPGQQ